MSAAYPSLAASSDIVWAPDFGKGLLQAQQKNKFLFVDLIVQEQDLAPFADADVANLVARDYVGVKVDVDSPFGQSLMHQFHITEVPTLLLYDRTGTMKEMTKGGYKTGNDLIRCLSKLTPASPPSTVQTSFGQELPPERDVSESGMQTSFGQKRATDRKMPESAPQTSSRQQSWPQQDGSASDPKSPHPGQQPTSTPWSSLVSASEKMKQSQAPGIEKVEMQTGFSKNSSWPNGQQEDWQTLLTPEPPNTGSKVQLWNQKK